MSIRSSISLDDFAPFTTATKQEGSIVDAGKKPKGRKATSSKPRPASVMLPKGFFNAFTRKGSVSTTPGESPLQPKEEKSTRNRSPERKTKKSLKRASLDKALEMLGQEYDRLQEETDCFLGSKQFIEPLAVLLEKEGLTPEEQVARKQTYINRVKDWILARNLSELAALFPEIDFEPPSTMKNIFEIEIEKGRRINEAINKLLEPASEIKEYEKFNTPGYEGARITEVPKGIHQLLSKVFVKTIDFSHNRIRRFGDSFASLRDSLTQLDLSHNIVMEEFPPGVCDCVNLTHLNLSYNSIKEIPYGINDLRKLIELNVSHNCLQYLHNSIGDCLDLKVLDVSHNRLTTLTECLGFLKKIERLSVNDNDLQYLPGEYLVGMRALKHIDISHNNLPDLPNFLWKFAQITTVSASGACSVELRDSTKKAKRVFASFGVPVKVINRLTDLIISKNGLTCLPKDIGGLQALRSLDVRGNSIEELPPSLNDCSTLEVIHAEDNNIKQNTIDANLLNYLFLSGNPINQEEEKLAEHNEMKETMEELNRVNGELGYFVEGKEFLDPLRVLLNNEVSSKKAEMTRLRTYIERVKACLSVRNLDEFASRFSEVTIDEPKDVNLYTRALERGKRVREAFNNAVIVEKGKYSELNWQGNNKVRSTELSDEVLDFLSRARVKKFDLSKNRLLRFGEGFSILRHSLTDLNLSGNSIEGFPKGICDCTRLEKLNLNGNILREVPREIENLSRLRELYLSHTELVNLPHTIGSNTELRVLDVSHNGLTYILECLGNLGKLERLIMNDNRINSIPTDDLCGMWALSFFNVSNNELSKLPTNFPWGCKRIKNVQLSNACSAKVDASGNRKKVEFTTFGLKAESMKTLIEVNLAFNGLISLPSDIGEAPMLQYIDLNDNALPGLPTTLRLTNERPNRKDDLKRLNISNNQIKHIPVDPDKVLLLMDYGNPITSTAGWRKPAENEEHSNINVDLPQDRAVQIKTRVSRVPSSDVFMIGDAAALSPKSPVQSVRG